MTNAARPRTFWLTALAVLCFVIWFAVRGWSAVRIESSLLDLLPRSSDDRNEMVAIRRFADQASGELLLLVSTGEAAQARDAAAAFAAALRASPAFGRVQFEIDVGMVEAAQARLDRPAALLSDRHRDWLSTGRTDALLKEATAAAYAPLGFARPFELADDPLGLAAEALNLATANGAAQLEDDYLAVHQDGRVYALIRTQLAGNPYALPLQDQVLAALAAARLAAQKIDPNAEAIGSGVVLHAAEGAQRAQREIAWFGTLGTVAIVVLMLAVFRSLWPLLLTLGILALASAAAASVCQAVFGNVHLLTLTFGTSLIGVAVDYALHYFSHRLADTPSAPHELTPALLLGCCTTITGYLALLIAPIAGMRQIALYSAVGLLVACAAVLLLLPHINTRTRARVPTWARRLNGVYLTSRVRMWLLLGMACITAMGLTKLRVLDDVRTLQRPSPTVVAAEQQLRQVLQSGFDTRFLLVTGKSEEQVLAREEQLRTRMPALQRRGVLADHFAVSQSLPSLARQAQNRQLLAQYVAGNDGALARILKTLGFPTDQVAQRVAAYQAALQKNYLPRDWLASAASEPWRTLWLQLPSGEAASIVLLRELHDAAALRSAIQDLPGVRFVDQVSEINRVLRQFRRTMMAVLFAVAGIVLIVLLARYRSANALTTALPAIGSVLLTTALLGLIGEPLTLFNSLALLLVLGMGDDFAIFLREDQHAATTLAVVLCSLTTLLSFGLLAFSSVPFVHSIGLTITIGIACALPLSLLLRIRRTH